MKVFLILDKNITLENYSLDFNDAFLIGVDRGSYLAVSNGISLNLAIGDFDSVTEEEYTKIKDNSLKVIKLEKEKDSTDTLEAIRKAFEISSDVTILGGFQGKRIEHLLANVCLLKNNNITLIDDYSKMFILNKGTHVFEKDDYKYISFFAFDKVVKGLSLTGFKYSLSNYKLDVFNSLCISNEVIEKKGTVSFKCGKLLIIKTKKD